LKGKKPLMSEIKAKIPDMFKRKEDHTDKHTEETEESKEEK